MPMHNEAAAVLAQDHLVAGANASEAAFFWFTFTYLAPAVLAGREVAVNVN